MLFEILLIIVISGFFSLLFFTSIHRIFASLAVHVCQVEILFVGYSRMHTRS